MIQCVEKQRRYFRTGATRSLKYRKAQLLKLENALMAHENAIYDALHKDLKKPVVEAFGSEFFGMHRETRVVRKKLHRWSRPRRVSTPWLLFPGRAMRIAEPYGNVLIISPWKYPFDLALMPLIGAIAAGNTVLLKPSELLRTHPPYCPIFWETPLIQSTSRSSKVVQRKQPAYSNRSLIIFSLPAAIELAGW